MHMAPPWSLAYVPAFSCISPVAGEMCLSPTLISKPHLNTCCTLKSYWKTNSLNSLKDQFSQGQRQVTRGWKILSRQYKCYSICEFQVGFYRTGIGLAVRFIWSGNWACDLVLMQHLNSFDEVSEGKNLHICGRNILNNLTSTESDEITKERGPST